MTKVWASLLLLLCAGAAWGQDAGPMDAGPVDAGWADPVDAGPKLVEGAPVIPRADAIDATGTVLVLDVGALDVPEALAARATDALAQGLTGVEGLSVMEAGELRSAVDLVQAREALGCEAEEECLAKIARANNADWMVSGRLGRVGEKLTLSLVLYEGGDVFVRNRVSLVLDGERDLDEQSGALVRELFHINVREISTFKLRTEGPVSFALLPLDATGVGPKLAKNLTEILAVELKRIEGARVISLEDVQAIIELERGKVALGCERDMSCLVEIGNALGADKLVVGQVGALGDTYVLGARLIDLKAVTVDNRVTESFRGGEEQLIRAVRFLGQRLTGVEETATGALIVTTNVTGAELFVDGASRGPPGPPIEDLRAGRHEVRVTRDGYLAERMDVYVTPGETTGQWVALEKEPRALPAVLPEWGFWSLAAGTGGLALGSVVVSGAILGTQARANELRDRSLSEEVSGKEIVQLDGLGGTLNWVNAGLVGGTVLMGGLTAAGWFFTDFEEDDDVAED